MKGDDRPRRSKPKKPVAEGTAVPPQCANCGLVFTEDVLKHTLKPQRYSDGTVRCREHKACRKRALTIALAKELGVTVDKDWLFCAYPRERLFDEMDVRPGQHTGKKPGNEWKETGWLPRFDMEHRVMACVLLSSWCYPVSLPYAVQLAGTCPRVGRADADPDEIITDFWKHPIPLRVGDIARILNEHQSAVSRALKRLRDRGDLRVDEDHVLWPAAKLALLSIAQRQALYGQEILTPADRDLRGIPKRYRDEVALIQEHCQPDISTGIRGTVVGACTSFNTKLRRDRTERDHIIEQACSAGRNLIPEFETLLRNRRAGVSSTPASGPPAQNSPVDEDGGIPVKELYTPLEAASPQPVSLNSHAPAEALYHGIPALQAEFPNAPFARPKFSALGKADRQLAIKILDGLEGVGWHGPHRTITAADVTEFLAWVETRFRSGKRAPETVHKVALFVFLAGEWAGEAPERAQAEAHWQEQEAVRQERDAELRAELAAEAALNDQVDDAWEQMPTAELTRRRAITLTELKGNPDWKKWKASMTDKQLADIVEQYVKRTLRRELRESETAQGPSGKL